MDLVIRSIRNAHAIFVGRDFYYSGAPKLRREVYSGSLLRERVIVSLERCASCDIAALTTLRALKSRLKHRLEIVIPAGHPALVLLELVDWTDDLRPVGTLSEALIRCATGST